ncbi:MAG: SMC family ATPase [Acidimicrobiia bacterium]
MRPVALHLAGFTAYRAPTDIDFQGADLFALTGPTGSGKSSIIDAICFALYGAIPRLTGVAPVVSLGKPEARIRLVFEVEGETWTVSRLIVRHGEGASQRDVRLEGPGVALEGVREVDARIVRLLGLGFDHFTRTVVLPQGRFAAFLEDGPAAREKLLKQLLDLGVYEEMRKRGASHATRLEGEIAVIDAQCHDLLVDEDQVIQAQHRLDRLVSLRDFVAEAAATQEKAATALREAREARERVVVDLGRLAAVKAPVGLDDMSAALAAARSGVDDAREKLAVAQAAAVEIDARRAELGELSALDGAIAIHTRIAELTERLARGSKLVEEAKAVTQKTLDEFEAAVARVDDSAASLGVLEQAHAAHAIRAHLQDGDECPVCQRLINAVPGSEPPADLEAARDTLAKATAARDAVNLRLAESRAELARLEGHLEQRTEELADARSAAGGQLSLDDARQRREAAGALDTEVGSARAALTEAGARHDRAVAALEAAEKAGAAASETLDRARDTLAGLEPPVAQRAHPAADWATLLEWCKERQAAFDARRVELDEEANRRESEVGEARAAIEAAAAEAGLSEVGDDVKVSVAAAIAKTEATLQRLQADLEKRRDLESRRKTLDGERLRYDETAKLLRSNRFQQWMIEEALVGLVDFANAELTKLAGGAYSLAVVSGDFEVIDHRNAEARRSVKTLSGGETFLVSLALALALAERVVATSAIGTARIESMFLDEGFGTLDSETLDVVASVVTELGSRDRMIGLVTHVRELADQIPTRFEVRKLPDGATVTRVDA